MFSVCSHWGGGGTRAGPDGGRGVSQPGADGGGVPRPGADGGGILARSRQGGVTPARSRWGGGTWPGMGYPWPGMGYPLPPRIGQQMEYLICGMPLAFTQEDFLVLFAFSILSCVNMV